MDLKVLFHNPEQLSEEDLAHLRQKITLQRSMPWTGAFLGGFAMYFLDTAILKRTACTKRIAALSLVGFILGAYSSYQVRTSLPGF